MGQNTKKITMDRKTKQAPPDHPRHVLTWVKDRQEMEFWQIDSYFNNSWFEAESWGHQVLYWVELPTRRDKKMKEDNNG